MARPGLVLALLLAAVGWGAASGARAGDGQQTLLAALRRGGRGTRGGSAAGCAVADSASCESTCGTGCASGCSAGAPAADAQHASTTNFAYSGASACGCSGDDLRSVFGARFTATGESWAGLATPAWMAGAYKGYKEGDGCCAPVNNECDCTAGSTCPFSNQKPGTYNTCASGTGGCGTCWKLTSLDVSSGATGNNCGSSSCGVPANVTIFGIVTDNCGLEDGGGNNQWCVPYLGLTSCDPLSCGVGSAYSDKCARQGSQQVESSCGGELVAPGKWTRSNTSTSTTSSGTSGPYFWSDPSCVTNPGVDGNYDDFLCSNAAGYKMHFDVAVQQQDSSALGAWFTANWKQNAVVQVEQVVCPADLMTQVAGACVVGKGDVTQWNYCDASLWAS